MFLNTAVWIKVMLAILVAFVVSIALTPFVKRLAVKVGAVDVPGEARRVHDHPIPRMGGLAIFLGFIVSTLLFADITQEVRGILIGSIIIVITGVIDDIVSLRAWTKFLIQILAAVIAVLHGVVINVVSNPNVFSNQEAIVLGWVAIPLTVLWIVGITNSVNLIDGLDGLAVGVSTISCVTILVVALLVSEPNVALIVAALAGACIGFMPYNLNPARIFMGDTGSLLLGYVLATVSVLGLFKFYAIVTFVVPVLALAVPLSDTLFAFCRRILHGQSPFHADRGHFHHKLMDLGLNQKQAVAILYAISATLGLAAVVLTTKGTIRIALLILALLIGFVVCAFIRKSVHKHHLDVELQEARPQRKRRLPQQPKTLRLYRRAMMSKRIKVMSVFGTRPEAIKMAPLVLELQKHPALESVVCITAQHREMLDSVMDCFGIRADYDLNIMQQGQDLTAITTRVLERMRDVLSEVQPDIVLVHGDTTTTFAGALAAFYAKIPVGHVEAGLRTYDRWSPFPEEMNRALVGRIATLHFAPTANNARNLEREAVEGDIFVTGNTVIDAMNYTVRGEQFVSDELQQVDFSHRVIAMTCHRRENYGEPMRSIFTAVRRLALDYPDVEIVYPVHLSPVVRDTARELLGGVPNIRLIAPLDAVDMHRLMARSYMVMTDSGGIQEEAPALGKPVLVLRRETERPEAVTAGTVKLAGTDTENIYRLAAELLDDPAAYDRMAKAVNPYGDGQACPRIAQAILSHFLPDVQPPEPFAPAR